MFVASETQILQPVKIKGNIPVLGKVHVIFNTCRLLKIGIILRIPSLKNDVICLSC